MNAHVDEHMYPHAYAHTNTNANARTNALVDEHANAHANARDGVYSPGAIVSMRPVAPVFGCSTPALDRSRSTPPVLTCQDQSWKAPTDNASGTAEIIRGRSG